jgi:haloacetate dehalogenase
MTEREAQVGLEEGLETGVNRRHLFQTLAAGAAVSGVIGSPARAQQASAAVLTVASPADYTLNPTRWGSAEVAGLFPGFQHLDMRTSGAVIRLRHGGSGPPLLLLHGNPENHVAWHKIASRLAKNYHVVLPDLRGYGDSSLPEPGPNHINYSFRAMAQDMIEVMEQLGYSKFYLAGHDRGGRTSHRMCLDHPERVMKVCLMDEPFPERMMSAVPAEFFLKSRMVIRGGNGLDFLTPAVFDEYVRCYTLKTITGSCRDYRATATCDFEMDTADKDRKIEMPAIVLWGARGQSPARSKEFLDVWKKFATNLEYGDGMDCGHYMAEDIPDIIHEKFTKFFVA